MALAAVALLVSLGYLLALALGGAQMTRYVSLRGPATIQEHHLAWPWLLVALLAGLGSVAGWASSTHQGRRAAERDRARRDALEHEHQRLEQERARVEKELAAARRDHAEARGEAEGHRGRVGELEREAAVERSRAEEAQRLRELERHWNRELRNKVLELTHERGSMGDYGDIRSLVLRLAVTLVDAQKGLLLTRRAEDGGDGDTNLEVVAAEGFDHDPTDSALVQRFGSKVLKDDETVREDEPQEIPEGDDTPADREIENLVAIPIYIRDEFSGAVVCANRDGGFEELDDDVLISLGDHAGAVLDNHRLHGDLRSSYLGTVRVLAEAIGAKDAALRSHSDEVAGYVVAVADRLGIPSSEREDLLFGSLLHDVGKIGISERILLKPGRLTPEEFGVVKLHPRIGSRLVQQVPALRKVVPGVLHHHERFDGTGYPSGLSGEEIPLSARIIAVADAFSAMIASRPYRELVSPEDACAEIERCAGSQFDPQIVELFCEEVRSRPPGAGDGPLAVAFDDPELGMRAEFDGAVLGSSSLAMTDSLTLLYSHRYFFEHADAEAQRAGQRGQPFSLLAVELADIDEVNLREGFAAGDALIRRAAGVTEVAAIRAGGTACRYSGRRLALVLPVVDELAAARLGTELSDELDRAGITARTGAAGWREGETGADVAARALLALDAARG
jgi:diguanylate cyclase (GGDEF)-like protein